MAPEQVKIPEQVQIPEQVKAAARDHRYPLIFATVSGAHLYGFPSPNSDWDLRGVHVLPVEQVVRLLPLEETVEITHNQDIELDLVTHDLRKFIKLLLRPNGYVLEQLLSPILVHTSPEHEALKQLAPACLTRHHAHHYIGFADSQWKLFRKEEPPRVKPLLYTFRVLLTGIHLMRSGQIEPNLNSLNAIYNLPFIPDLIARKLSGAEQQTLDSAEIQQYEREFHLLRDRLIEEAAKTHLPDSPTAQPALNDLLVKVRLASPQKNK
jgi:predicted nucleotidyltransferase